MATLKEKAEEWRIEKESDTRIKYIANRLQSIKEIEEEIKTLEDESTPLRDRDW